MLCSRAFLPLTVCYQTEGKTSKSHFLTVVFEAEQKKTLKSFQSFPAQPPQMVLCRNDSSPRRHRRYRVILSDLLLSPCSGYQSHKHTMLLLWLCSKERKTPGCACGGTVAQCQMHCLCGGAAPPSLQEKPVKSELFKKTKY